MTSNQSLQNLLNGTASEEDVELLKRLLASGEISIGGNVNQSVIIIGSGNTVELPPAALDRLNARPMLGNLDRDLTGEEVASGLRRLDKLLPNRAPIFLPHYKEQVGRLRPTLKTEIKSLSESSRRERVEALAAINSICVEALDVSFNGLSLGEEAPKYDARSPFRGLESFRPGDSEFFFGREALTCKLVAQIQAHPFLAVLGASGSGKSSLVMAGVIPALDSDYVIFRPGTNPLDELESARGKSLIVVDQFEELFTLTRDESTRKDFIACLLDLATRSRIILTLRSDFLGEVGVYRTLSAEIQNHLEIVPPMDMDELRRAMEGQAGVVGLRFEADLSQQILDEVAGEPGAMPLLQHALWELWNRRHGRNLRASEYRAFGGVKQAITSTAEIVYADCSKPEQEQLRDIFLRLTRLDDSDEGRDTRRRVPLGDLIPSGRDAASITLLLDKLANARLIVKTVNEDKTEVEVAHEALIRHWERLRLWLNDDRDNLRLREGIIETARQWETSGRNESLLIHRAGRLDDAVSLSMDTRYGLTNVEQAYLKECDTYQKKEQNRRERLRKQITTGLGVGFAVVLAVAILATLQWQRAEQLSKIALARQLAIQSQSLSVNDSNNRTALLLATLSLKLDANVTASKIIYKNKLSHQISSLTDDCGSVTSIAFSRDGKYIVSGGDTSIVCVWEALTGRVIVRMKHDGDVAPETVVSSVAFSSDGKYVISGSLDDTARVWEADTGKEISRMTHDYWVYSVAISPNGKYVVSGSLDKTARVWEAATGKEIARMTHNDYLISVAFSPDGKYIVSGSVDKTARVWEATTGKEIARMTYGDKTYDDHTGMAPVAFSRNGKYVVSGSADGTARVWQAATGKEIARMTHDGGVYSVAFSPDDKSVVSGSTDGTARVWEASTGKEIARMTHVGGFVTFSPDGLYVVSAGGDDNTIRIWETTTGREISRIESSSEAVALSPDGNYVASGGKDGIAGMWQVKTGIIQFTSNNNLDVTSNQNKGYDEKYYLGIDNKRIILLNIVTEKEITLENNLTFLPVNFNEEYAISSYSISPNEKYAVGGGNDKTARVWEISTGKEITRISQETPVDYVSFSPDGNYIVSSSCNHGININSIDIMCDQVVALVWETTTGKEIAYITFDDFYITYVSFSPDGKFIVSPSNYHSAVQETVWRPQDLIENACSRVTRNLTLTEWKQYIGDALPYQAICPNVPLDLEYLKAIAGEALLNTTSSNRVKTAFTKVKAELIKVDAVKNPTAESLRIVSVATGEQILAEIAVGEVGKALDLFEQAKQMQLKIYLDDKNAYNNLCWIGSLQGYEKQVLQYCEQAVLLAPNDSAARDSRGLARALTGDYKGAIIDFQYFVEEEIKIGNAQNGDVKNRQQWIIYLKAGKNPFTPEVLELLKNPGVENPMQMIEEFARQTATALAQTHQPSGIPTSTPTP